MNHKQNLNKKIKQRFVYKKTEQKLMTLKKNYVFVQFIKKT